MGTRTEVENLGPCECCENNRPCCGAGDTLHATITSDCPGLDGLVVELNKVNTYVWSGSATGADGLVIVHLACNGEIIGEWSLTIVNPANSSVINTIALVPVSCSPLEIVVESADIIGVWQGSNYTCDFQGDKQITIIITL